MGSAPPESWRARNAAVRTRSKRLGILSTQSSTGTRAMKHPSVQQIKWVSSPKRRLPSGVGAPITELLLLSQFFAVPPAGQAVQQLPHALAGNRMPPGGCDFGQRNQNKGALRQSGMGKRDAIAYQPAVIIQKIKIEAARRI